MSKIKTSNLTPRTKGGSVTIGEERSTTYFHKDSDVVIPGYATKDYVDEVASAAPRGNPVFHLNDNKLVRSYTIPDGKNAGTFGELEMDDNVDVRIPDGSTWTIVGNKEVGDGGTVALRDLVDTDIPMIPQPDAMLWYDEFSGKWKPKTISSLPSGPAGQDGEDGKSAYEIYAETTSNSPIKTVQEWLGSLQGSDGEDGKDSLEVWLEKNPGSTEEDYFIAMKGPQGDQGLSSFEVWLESNPGGTEEEYWASLEGPIGKPGPGFNYKGNVATESDLPNDPASPNSDGDAYLVEDVNEMFAWGADDQWHSLGQIQGPQGDEGDKGETGDSAYEIWLKSNPGKTEQEFLDSLKGEKGDTGEDGEDGLAQMVGVGSTITLDAGESASVTQNPSLSTQEKIILDFGIPKGADGVKGNDGLEGAPGADGDSAYDTWIAAGNSGSEQDFLDSIVGDTGEAGKDGFSAYEIAVDNGYGGTEEEWLKTLVGEKGDAGPEGDSAYQVWLDSGKTGTEQDFLDSLKGDDKVPDYSASDAGKQLQVDGSGNLVWSAPSEGVGYNILDNSEFIINKRAEFASRNSTYIENINWHSDRWKKGLFDARQIWQGVHENSYEKNQSYVLSYYDQFGTRVENQLTSPSSGNWQVSIPDTATKPKLERGTSATAWTPKPYNEEVSSCARYFRLFEEKQRHAAGPITMGGASWTVGWSEYFEEMVDVPEFKGDFTFFWTGSTGGLVYKKSSKITGASDSTFSYTGKKTSYHLRVTTDNPTGGDQASAKDGSSPNAAYAVEPYALDAEEGITTGVASSSLDFDASFVSSVKIVEQSEEDPDNYIVTTTDGIVHRFVLEGGGDAFGSRIKSLIDSGLLVPTVIPVPAPPEPTAEQMQAEADRESAISKLEALGLTRAEINALI